MPQCNRCRCGLSPFPDVWYARLRCAQGLRTVRVQASVQRTSAGQLQVRLSTSVDYPQGCQYQVGLQQSLPLLHAAMLFAALASSGGVHTVGTFVHGNQCTLLCAVDAHQAQAGACAAWRPHDQHHGLQHPTLAAQQVLPCHAT